jgi:hypothetical protein
VLVLQLLVQQRLVLVLVLLVLVPQQRLVLVLVLVLVLKSEQKPRQKLSIMSRLIIIYSFTSPIYVKFLLHG